MKALKKHPNIIELIDVIDDERKDKKYIVLELANGCNLQELLLSAPDSVRVPRGGCCFFCCLFCCTLKSLGFWGLRCDGGGAAGHALVACCKVAAACDCVADALSVVASAPLALFLPSLLLARLLFA